MVNTGRQGKRCRAKRMIHSHGAVITSFHQGTITYEMDNLDRRLILVQWDAGVSTYVFPHEVEILGERQFDEDGTEQSA